MKLTLYPVVLAMLLPFLVVGCGSSAVQTDETPAELTPIDNPAPPEEPEEPVDPPPPPPIDPLAFYNAGAAKVEISPTPEDLAGEELDAEGEPQFFNLGGYGTRPLALCPPEQPFFNECFEALSSPGPAEGIAQETFARAMVIQFGGQTVAFLNLDATGAGNIILNAIRDSVNAATGIERENILIAETHSHSAADLQGLWGGVPQRWRTELIDKTTQAVTTAFDALEPVQLEVAARDIDFNNYRREGGDDPTDPNAVFVTDKTITALRAVAIDDGAGIGTVIQYTAHPTVLSASNRLVHTDYVLAMEQLVEQALGGTAVYFNGVIADASPKAPEGFDDRYQRADALGLALGSEVISMLSEPDILPVEDLLIRHQTVVLPVANPLFLGAGGMGWFDGYYNFTDPASGESGRIDTLVSRVRIGDPDGMKLEIATVPGEATGTFGAMIREFAGGPYQMLCGLTQNSLGYILPEDEFGREGNNYEETVSLGPQTAPLLENSGYRIIFDQLVPAP